MVAFGAQPPMNPSDASYLAWNYDPVLIGGDSSPSTGVLYLLRVNLRQAALVTSVALGSSAGGTDLVAGENFAGLYNSAGVLLGQSADQSSAWASSGLYTAALTDGPVAVPQGFAWVGILANESGGTTPGFWRCANASSPGQNAGLTAATARAATNGSTLAALPASITPSSNSFTGAAFWVALS
jgi:hypothetical protein